MTVSDVPVPDAGGRQVPGLVASGGYAGRPSLAVDRDSPTPPTSHYLAEAARYATSANDWRDRGYRYMALMRIGAARVALASAEAEIRAALLET